MELIGAAVTDTGIKKKINQDSVAIKVARTDLGDVGLVILCDGLGGLESGELASALALKKFTNWFEQRLPGLLRNNILDLRIEVEWRQLVDELNRQIGLYGNNHGVRLGTTLTAMLIVETKYYVIHVGDTRIYQISDSFARVLTRDHTFIAQEIAAGRMTVEEAMVDKRRNMLLQCVGASEVVSPDFFVGQFDLDSTYMLCSDGFRHLITEQEIIEHLEPAAVQSCEVIRLKLRKLIDLNKSRDEKDNISAVAIRSI